MAKDFGEASCLADVLDRASESAMKKVAKSSTPRPDVIAIRKTCDAEGTGLSHYVLMDKQVKR
jgi:modified peptide precursor CbpA